MSEGDVRLTADRAGGTRHPVSATAESRDPQRGAETPRGLGGGSTTTQKVSESQAMGGGSTTTQKVSEIKHWEDDPQQHKK